MEIILYNAAWMVWNIALALFAVLFGRSMLSYKFLPARFIFFLLWLLFVPNTIYIVTDIQHVFRDIPQVAGNGEVAIILFEYIVLEIIGIISFVYALHLFEILIKKSKQLKPQVKNIMYITNFIIAFGVIIGRVHRTNSWYVFTDPMRVVNDSIITISSLELMVYVALFGIAGNIIYFSLRNPIIKLSRKFHKLSKIPGLKPLVYLTLPAEKE